mmetsp:Transcript_13774/g.48628  ORF Transcript_13774/g.48628 Transcript_13774/m.48628 type:complete len:208 (-) Transcript_13774:1106-1729(-)
MCRPGEVFPSLGAGLAMLHHTIVSTTVSAHGSTVSPTLPLEFTRAIKSLPTDGVNILLDVPVMPAEFAVMLQVKGIFILVEEHMPRSLPGICRCTKDSDGVMAKIWDAGLPRRDPPKQGRRRLGAGRQGRAVRSREGELAHSQTHCGQEAPEQLRASTSERFVRALLDARSQRCNDPGVLSEDDMLTFLHVWRDVSAGRAQADYKFR